MKRFVKLPLSLAVMSVLATSAFANEQAVEPTVVLEGDTIVIDRQGTKVKTNVVTEEEKDESTTTDLRGLLTEEPAIDFGGGNGASQFWTIRGMGQNSIDVKIDNAYSDAQVLYHQGRFTLDPSLVKIVSVQKGAGSASAGIGATNGAIIAKTIDAKDLLKNSDKDYGVKINAGYSSNDEYSYGLTAFGQTDNFDLLISGNRVNQENYKPGEGYVSPYDGSDKVAFSALDKVSYLAKAGLNVGDHRFVLSHFKETNKGTRNIREEFDYFAGQDPQYRELSLENTNLEWKADNIGFDTAVDANVYLMKNERFSGDDAQNNYSGRLAGENKTEVETRGANLNFTTDANDTTTLKYGVNYRHQQTTPNQYSAGVTDQEKTDTGVYLEAIGEIGNVTATAGVRYDHFDFLAMDGKKVSHGSINPSVGLIWQPTSTLSFNANYYQATRSPRMVDALLSHGLRGVVSIADNVKPETAKNTEVGFNYNNGNLSVSGSYFWQRIDDLLNSGSIARHGTGATLYDRGIDNVGYAKNHGYEVNAAYRLGGLTARVGVAESNPEFYSTPDDAGNLPSFATSSYAARVGRIWMAGLAYRFAKPNLEIGVNHRLAEDAQGSSAWMVHQGTAARQNNIYAERPGYNVTDVYANWKPFNNDMLNVNFGINNITDELYRSHSQGAGANSLPGVGREYRVGVNYTF